MFIRKVIMMSDTKNKTIGKIKQFIPILFFMMIGAMGGVFIAKYMRTMKLAEESTDKILFSAALLLVGMYIAIFLQIIIHEAGHLLFGLMNGYGFSSFRVGSFMWVKEGGRIKFRRFSLVGTGGQCLLIPPKMKDGKYPYVLYNLGGSIINMVSALLFAGLALLGRNINILSQMLMMLAVVGVAYALINAIPLQLEAVNNDGYNAFSLGKNQEALVRQDKGRFYSGWDSH